MAGIGISGSNPGVDRQQRLFFVQFDEPGGQTPAFSTIFLDLPPGHVFSIYFNLDDLLSAVTSEGFFIFDLRTGLWQQNNFLPALAREYNIEFVSTSPGRDLLFLELTEQGHPDELPRRYHRRIYSLRDGRLVWNDNDGSVFSPEKEIAWSLDGSKFAYYQWETIRIIDTDGATEVKIPLKYTDLRPSAMVFSPDGRFFITSHEGVNLRIWSTDDWQHPINLPNRQFLLKEEHKLSNEIGPLFFTRNGTLFFIDPYGILTKDLRPAFSPLEENLADELEAYYRLGDEKKPMNYGGVVRLDINGMLDSVRQRLEQRPKEEVLGK